MNDHPSVQIELGVLEHSCCVVMPFAAVFTREYDQVIKPAVESAGLKCIRGDEI